MAALPATLTVEIATRPPVTLYRMALSTRFATRLSASLGSPAAAAADSAVLTSRPRRSAVLVARRDDVARDLGQVEGLPLLDAALAAGQREQRLDEAFLLVAQGQRLLAGRPQRRRAGVRVGERHLEQGPFRGERGAQLVRGVGDEVPL